MDWYKGNANLITRTKRGTREVKLVYDIAVVLIIMQL